MNLKLIIACMMTAASTTAVFAQDMTRDQLNQRPKTMQPDQPGMAPGNRMNDSSQGGTPSGTQGSGTLMQQRQQGMSPEAGQTPAGRSSSTGAIKQ